MISIKNLLFTMSCRSSIGPLENILLSSTLKNEIPTVNTFALLLLKHFWGKNKTDNSNLFQDFFYSIWFTSATNKKCSCSCDSKVAKKITSLQMLSQSPVQNYFSKFELLSFPNINLQTKILLNDFRFPISPN